MPAVADSNIGENTVSDTGAGPTALEHKAFGISLAIVCGLILAVAVFVDFSRLGTPSICVFYRTTGLPCGGCGLSRSCCAIAHGRWEEAWLYNPFGYVFMPLFIVGFVGGLLTAWRPALRPLVLPSSAFMFRTGITVSIALSVFGGWRLYDLVGWKGMKDRVFNFSGSPPPVVLLHGDATIQAPRPKP
jgi:hypothetical protein